MKKITKKAIIIGIGAGLIGAITMAIANYLDGDDFGVLKFKFIIYFSFYGLWTGGFYYLFKKKVVF